VSAVPTYDLGFLADTVEELAAFGKPLHITEQSVSSSWDERFEEHGAGYWRRRWDEAAQADYLEAVYRLLFGIESVQAITWWNAVDDLAFINGGGLFRADGSAKPALLRLEALIDEWTTSGIATTGGDGTVRIEGFAGGYAVVAEAGEAAATTQVHLGERARVELTLTLQSPGRRVVGRR
jgi:hypothetical protein